MLQPPSATLFDAIASIVSLLAYLVVAIAVLLRFPRDGRARVFLAVAATSAVPYVLSPLQWWKGSAAYTPTLIMATAVAFSLGGAALLHFTQIFPKRRPWIQAHGNWLAAAYVLLPPPIAFIAWFLGSMLVTMQGLEATGAGGMGAVSADTAMSLVLLLAIPAVFVIGIVLPFAGIMSLFKSWQEARAAADEPARKTTMGMLISQMGGGVLAILVLPLLHVIGIGPAWAMAIGALTYAFALLMPLAFAVGVLRYGALDGGAPASTPQFRNSTTPNERPKTERPKFPS